MTRQVVILYFDAASGHRSAAAALKQALDSSYPDWQVRLVNVVDIFDKHKRFGPLARFGIDRFNRQLKKDKVFDLSGQINLSLLFHDLLSTKGIAQLATFWADVPPDIVLSVTPMYNPALYKSVRLVNSNALCITVPVDFEEAKPRYWFTPKIEQHYFNGTARLIEQAKALGIPLSHNHLLAGMIVDPSCYQAPPTNKTLELSRLGLDATLPTGLISFGGQGCTHVETIANAIAQSDLKVNMIFLCGRNTAVYDALNQLETPYPKLVLGYLPETPIYYLHLADFAIGKPGAMTITEAIITQTPLIALKSRGMRLVQRGNETWLTDHKVGILADGVGQVVPAIRELLSTNVYQQRTAEHSHRAVFEAVELLGQLVNQHFSREFAQPLS